MATTTKAIHETIRLNNMGVGHFEHGRIDQAIQFFVQALTVSKQIIIPNYGQQNQGIGPSMARDEKMITEPEFLMGFMDAENYDYNNGDLQTNQEKSEEGWYGTSASQPNIDQLSFATEAFVYQNTFRLPEDGLGLENCCASYSLICMFNLAITHHVHALSSREDDSSFVVAWRLYELSFALLSMEGIEADIMVTLAILNNLGQLHKRRRKEADARRCFENLLSILVYRWEARTIGNGEEIIRFFYSAVASELILSKPSTAPSA